MGQKSSKQSVVWTHWRCCREHGDWTCKALNATPRSICRTCGHRKCYKCRKVGQLSESVQEKKIFEYPDHDPDDPLHSPTGQGKEREDRKLEK